MDSDLLAFFLGIGGLVLYLIWSAKTEMGTRRDRKADRENR
jgi:hypothetical protein